jgi:hypothetical protein
MSIPIEEYNVFIFRVWEFPLPWPEDGDSLFLLNICKLQPSSRGAAICTVTRVNPRTASIIIYTYFKIWNQNMEVFQFKQSCTTNVEFGQSFYPDDLNCKLLWNIP